MEPTRNPFKPGAGARPAAVVGRDTLIQAATIALGRVGQGLPARGQLLLGLRGFGKTVLLGRIAELAEEQRCVTVRLEAARKRRLAELVVPPLRTALLALHGDVHSRAVAERALCVLRAFTGAYYVSVAEDRLDVPPRIGVADSGVLHADLLNLLFVVTEAAVQAERSVVMLADDLQELSDLDLSALMIVTHRAAHERMRLLFFCAALPQLPTVAGEAWGYAATHFDILEVGPVSRKAAEKAIRLPLEREKVDIEDRALSSLVEWTRGVPYFLQECGFHAWNVAERTPIGAADIEAATMAATESLDAGFFRVGLDRVTPRELDYLRGMAELGPGPHGSTDVAAAVDMFVSAAAPLRGSLVRKGILHGPYRGETAFTVPMFGDFLRRTMPDWRPNASPRETKARRRGRPPER